MTGAERIMLSDAGLMHIEEIPEKTLFLKWKRQNEMEVEFQPFTWSSETSIPLVFVSSR
jgi:hypothetical protein